MRHWLRRFLPDHTTLHAHRWLAPLRGSLLHPRLWHLNRRSAAGGVAAGMFCGLLPPPFQMPGAALVAIVFRINLPLALVTTLYTNPFTFVPLYLAAYWLGGQILGIAGHPAQVAAFVPPPEVSLAAIAPGLRALASWLGQLGLPLVVGVPTLASLFAVLGYLAVRIAWRVYLLKKIRRRRQR